MGRRRRRHPVRHRALVGRTAHSAIVVDAR
jgi:hypothetical protein